MASKAIKAAIVAAIVAIAGYWYWSPFVAVWQLQSAAQKKNVVAFNAHVDYPKVRESLKGQFSALLADKLAKTSESDNNFTKTGAAIGTMIGMVVANQFIDTVMQPATIMHAMQDGKLSPEATAPVATGPQPAGKPVNDKPSLTYERQGVDKLVAYVTNHHKPDETNQEKLGLVLQRSGFASWKLTEVRLPVLNM